MPSDLESRLHAHLGALARPRHARWDPLGLMSVRTVLLEELTRLGPVEQQRFQNGSDAGTNLILRLPGRQAQLAPLLIGAHYDGPLHSVGADDNATGVAALLELARRWAAKPPRRPVWVVAFDQEEWGMVGSKALAQHLRDHGQDLALMVSLEMLGYTAAHQSYPHPWMRHVYGERGDFIALVGNASLGMALSLLRLAHGLGQHVPTRVLPVPNGGRGLPDVRRSDHRPFWDRGYDAVMVTDTAFLRNPNYHQMSDTVDSLDLPFLAAVTEGLAEAFSGF